MNENNFYYAKLGRNFKFIFYVSLFAAIIAFDISLIFPVKYKSEIGVIVIQKQINNEVDAFSATKSAEYLSGILIKAIYTDGFLNDVLSAPFDIQKTFPIDAKEKKKEWMKTAKTRKINNTGIITITVLDESRLEAEKIAKAIAWNLSENGQKYHGGGDRVSITLIDGPITPIDPAWPKLWLNTLLGVLMGIVAAAGFIWNYPESRFLR